MKALILIIKREYLSRVRKKSFVVLTFLMPLLFFIAFWLPSFLAGTTGKSQLKKIIVVDHTEKYAPRLESIGNCVFENIVTTPEDINSGTDNDVLGILQITQDLSINPYAVTFFSDKNIPSHLLTSVSKMLSKLVQVDLLKKRMELYKINPLMSEGILESFSSEHDIIIPVMGVAEDQNKQEASESLASILGLFFPFLMYMFILMYGAMVMNGVVEEKSSRIVEVLISTVKPFQIMMGKIIGVGLTGLTQLGVWLFVGFALLLIGNELDWLNQFNLLVIKDQFSDFSFYYWGQLVVYFFLYFIGGYMIYASIFAMFGSIVDNAQDTQQFVLPITLLFLLTFYIGVYSLQHPNGAVAFWGSIIPFTSPIVMMTRIPFGVPLWEMLTSLVLLFTFIYVIVVLVSRVYRVGILMYGEKMSFKELKKCFFYD